MATVDTGQTEGDAISAIAREVMFLVRLAESARREEATLDRSAYLLLGGLDAGGPLGIGALAETFRMDISTASRQVAALEAKGFVERFPDLCDARVSLLRVTPLGHTQFGAARRARDAQYAAFLADWSAEERAQFAALLARFNRALVRQGKLPGAAPAAPAPSDAR